MSINKRPDACIGKFDKLNRTAPSLFCFFRNKLSDAMTGAQVRGQWEEIDKPEQIVMAYRELS
jgi:hypothetical protein